MIDDIRHKDYGYTVAQAISMTPAELDRDATGLWHLEARGRYGFGLIGTNLVEFVRRSIRALLDAGAVPVRHEPGSMFDWTIQRQYGSLSDEISEAIIVEWLALPDQSSSGLCGDAPWFALPDPKFPKFVKMD